jgi:hypothetical protein
VAWGGVREDTEESYIICLRKITAVRRKKEKHYNNLSTLNCQELPCIPEMNIKFDDCIYEEGRKTLVREFGCR